MGGQVPPQEKKIVRCALLAGLLALAAAARSQPVAEPAAADAAKARPTVGLVLSGGGARGLAHIGVLRVLREARVPVDVIAATSMGSLVGGAYAAGLSPDEIQARVFAVDWNLVFSNHAPRENQHWRRKSDDGRNLSKFEFGIGAGGLTLPSGALGVHEIEPFLRRLTASVDEIENLRRLPIPFIAMATDLETGAAVELGEVPLRRAMRASMSVPGVFAPVEIDGRLLVDGGLAANLPVDVARRLGADVVIAVNVGTGLAPREQLGTAVGVAQQMINILGEQNVRAAKRELRAGDVLIEPDFGRHSSTDFSKAAENIALGERATRAALASLQPLAVDAATYAALEQRRTSRLRDEAPVRITEVRVEGLTRTNPATVAAAIDVPRDTYLKPREVRAAVEQANAENKFERVDYRLETIGAGRVLVVEPVEKPWGPNTLRLGGIASSDFRSENTFNFLGAHTLTDVNAWGAEWRNEVQIGNASMLLTNLYQPLGAGSRWFVLPQFTLRRTSVDVFAGDHAATRVQVTSDEASLAAGYTVPRFGYVSLARTYGEQRVATQVAPAQLPTTHSRTDRWSVTALADRLDSYAFPRHGYLIAGSVDRYDSLGSPQGDPLTVSASNLLAAWSGGPNTLLLNAYFVRASRAGGGSQLGGFLNLSGTPRGRYTGSRTLFVGLIGYRAISDSLFGISAPVYLGASLEAGNSADVRDAYAWDQMKKAGALFVATDTLAGPIYFAYGKTAGGERALYLFWGLFWGRF